MSVVSVEELVPTSPVTESKTEVTCTREFLVTMSAAAYSNPMEALYATGIPARRDVYPFAVDGVARPICVSKSCTQYDKTSRLLWLVTVEYSNSPAKINSVSDKTDSDTAPWLRDPKYSYDFNEYETALERDLSAGKVPVVNTVGDKFDPPLTRTKVLPRVVITRASETFDQSVAAALYSTTNAASVTINGKTVAADMARLVKWSGEENEWTDPDGVVHVYYDETIEIELATDATNKFKVEVANTGYRYLVSGTATRIPDIATPAYISSDGTQYATGPAITPHYLTFTVYESTSWAALGDL